MKSLALLALLLCLPASALAERVTLDTRVSHPLVLAGQKQTVFLKVGLRGFALAPTGHRAAANVAIVIDKSGSMSGAKIEKAKEAAMQAVDRLGPSDIVSIVAYDSTVRVLVPATKATDKAALHAGIRRLSPGGSTALFAGVVKGAEELRKFLDRNRVNRLILLSDGLANVGPSSPGELENLGAVLVREGMSVTTLGLGLDYNEDLMSRLARAADGNHAFVERAEDLNRFFDLEFGDVLAVVAQDVTVNLRCADGVRPVRVLGRDADIVGSQVSARLNQLYAGHEKFLIVELEIASGKPGQGLELATVEATYGNMLNGASESMAGVARVRYSSSSAEVEASQDKDVMVSTIELQANERNESALVLRDQGRVEEARQVLQQNAVFLETNASRYSAPSLRSLKEANRDDAANLDGEQWQKQRKKMRKAQHTLDMQQRY